MNSYSSRRSQEIEHFPLAVLVVTVIRSRLLEVVSFGFPGVRGQRQGMCAYVPIWEVNRKPCHGKMPAWNSQVLLPC